MTPLRFFLGFVFLGTRIFFRNRFREFVLPIVASVMATFENIM